jgi:hypothetical protein
MYVLHASLATVCTDNPPKIIHHSAIPLFLAVTVEFVSETLLLMPSVMSNLRCIVQYNPLMEGQSTLM